MTKIVSECGRVNTEVWEYCNRPLGHPGKHRAVITYEWGRDHTDGPEEGWKSAT